MLKTDDYRKATNVRSTEYTSVRLHAESSMRTFDSVDSDGVDPGAYADDVAAPDMCAHADECVKRNLLTRDKAAGFKIVIDDKSSTDRETTEKQQKQHNEQSRTVFLNGLRGVAAISVSLAHAGFFKRTAIGPVSVDTFFVLSAFLLTMINEAKFRKLIQHKATAREWMVTIADYLVKRILRVYPLFVMVAIALTCMSPDMRNRYYNLEHYHMKHWSLFDVLTFAKGHRYYLFWTLPIEIGYYFIIPHFVIGGLLLGRFKWLAVALLYVWVLHDGAVTNRTGHNSFRAHLSPFVAGSLAATVFGGLDRWRRTHSFEPRKWQLAVLRAIETVFLGSVLSDTFHGMFVRWFHGSMFPSRTASLPLVCFPVSTVIVIEILAPSAISRTLEWNVLCYAGKISFSMYLLHPFVNFNPWVRALPPYDQFIVRLVLIFLLATASHYAVERPLQRVAVAIGKRLTRINGTG